MIIRRAEWFETDLERQFEWYLNESGLDLAFALELAESFAGAVAGTLNFLGRNPHAGQARFVAFSKMPGFRSWRLERPFNRFLIFYRVEGAIVFAERLLEGHRRLASDV